MSNSKLLEGIALANIVRVDVITEEATPEIMGFDTASEANLEPAVSEGTESELRVKNQIYAQNITETIIKGYNPTLTNVMFQPKVFALVDGGQSQVDDSDNFEEYNGPVAGQTANRTPFTVRIITEEKDYDGETLSYMAFELRHCKGSPTTVVLKDGEFYAPQYTLKSRPKKGERPVYIRRHTQLPRYVVAAEDLPAEGVTGVDYMVYADITTDGAGYSVGDILNWDGTKYAKKQKKAV